MVFSSRSIRDSQLIDALDLIEPKQFNGTVWRVVREGRDPRICNASGGRWDDGTFDVLYTARERDGAIAEMHFHLLRGQPVFPSKIRYKIFELSISLAQTLKLPTLEELEQLGLDISSYGQLSYDEKHREYPRTQDIAEAAQFMDFDGLIIPNARWNCSNVVAFCDLVAPGFLEVVKDHGLIDWASWRREHYKQR